MNLIVLVIVGFLFYVLTKGYKNANYGRIHVGKKQSLRGDIADHEAGLLVALMAKVAKADGKVCELEAELLGLTFTDISNAFENPEDIRDKLKQVYKKEINGFENTIDISLKYFNLTRREYSKRLKVMEYLLNLAFIDGKFSKTEFMVCEDIANALRLKEYDFKILINKFEQFYTQRETQASMNLDRAYGVLGLQNGTKFSIVKKEYRKLVRKNHPDILMGKGEEQSIIDRATRKLQEINEAYEIIKKSN